MNLPDGTACVHRACLSHKMYPCPFCGRIAGRALTASEKIAKALMDDSRNDVRIRSESEWFAYVVELITPIVEISAAGEVRFVYEGTLEPLINTNEEAKRLAAVIQDDFPIELPMSEPRPWLQMPSSIVDPWDRDTIRRLPKAIWDVVASLGGLLRDVWKTWRDDVCAFDRDMKIASTLPNTLLGLPVYVASSKREKQERRDHYWKTVIGPRLREYLKENDGNE